MDSTPTIVQSGRVWRMNWPLTNRPSMKIGRMASVASAVQGRTNVGTIRMVQDDVANAGDFPAAGRRASSTNAPITPTRSPSRPPSTVLSLLRGNAGSLGTAAWLARRTSPLSLCAATFASSNSGASAKTDPPMRYG